MYLATLSLRNFRNYRRLDLDLPPGLVVFSGGNSQGKSNLLEAVYMLALGRSPRTTTEGEVVGWSAQEPFLYAQVRARVATSQGSLQLQVDLVGQSRQTGAGLEPPAVQKRVRVNGVLRPVAGLVGQLNAVLFDASDIQLVEGPPALRRRYLDILISQVDSAYLRALQRYQRVLSQRNRLLRLIRERRAKEPELEFWDEEMAQHGAYLLSCRLQAVTALAASAGPLYARLLGGSGPLSLEYLPTVMPLADGEEALQQRLRDALRKGRQREVALGATQVGPHRDDLRVAVGGREVGVYGSRGERRLAGLALRLAEGEHLAQRRGEGPVLLLDDVLSELDETRGRQVLEAVAGYEQVLLTTTSLRPLVGSPRRPASTFRVVEGTVRPAGEAEEVGP